MLQLFLGIGPRKEYTRKIQFGNKKEKSSSCVFWDWNWHAMDLGLPLSLAPRQILVVLELSVEWVQSESGSLGRSILDSDGVGVVSSQATATQVEDGCLPTRFNSNGCMDLTV